MDNLHGKQTVTGKTKKRQGKGQEKRKRIYTLYILTNKYKGKKNIGKISSLLVDVA